MRGMDAAYHRRFFADVWITTGAVLALFVAGTAFDSRIFLAVPIVALLGANQTAFDASYLTFSRLYATRLEQVINTLLGDEVLIAHRLEDAYLYPLGARKIVTIPIRGPMTWFGFMTAFYTVLGASAYLVGLVLGMRSLLGHALVSALYLVALMLMTVSSLAFGGWWFVGGVGERRLETILSETFD